jgi:hypothetical protein
MILVDLILDASSRARFTALDVWEGSRERYPVCCVAVFAAGTALGVKNQAIRRGSVELPGGGSFVPCPAHRRQPGYEPWVYPDCGPYDDEDEPS